MDAFCIWTPACARMYYQKWPVQPEAIRTTHDAQQGSHGLSGQATK